MERVLDTGSPNRLKVETVAKALVIVESPAKAETIGRYLGDEFVVESSVGHIRDLATKKELPPELQEESWAHLGVETENNFKPHYVTSEHSERTVRNLKKALKGASELYLATDEDREGEAIAWHLQKVLEPTVPVHRMVFHEITKRAITEAVSNCRELDDSLVSAQETRRILDRLYGFEVSDVTRKKVGGGASAGRVQSAATRLLVERERERRAFVGANYWGLTVAVETTSNEEFPTQLVSIDGSKLARGTDFGDNGCLKRDDRIVLDEAKARQIAAGVEGKSFIVEVVKAQPYRRSPRAPFTTSTFQQAASSRLGFSAKRAMGAAQALYQKGYITYMRTDSTSLSNAAVDAARMTIRQSFGSDFLPEAPRRYQNKVRNAQEAHEAIRPAGDQFKSPTQVQDELMREADNKILVQIYQLVWERTLASQMTDVEGETTRVELTGAYSDPPEGEVDGVVTLSAVGTVISHPGFRKVYDEAPNVSASEEADGVDSERVIPMIEVGDSVVVTGVHPRGNTTQPPSRYSEASLVKSMEEIGIGRPSTYAATIDRIIDNEYAWKKGRTLYATVKAFAVTQLLENHFSQLVDYAFTAAMEDDLDAISNGDKDSASWLADFYWGVGDEIGLHRLVKDRGDEIDPLETCSLLLGTHEGEQVYARYRKTPYVLRGDATANIDPALPLDQLTVAKALEYLDTPTDWELGPDDETGLPVIVRHGIFGPYVSLGRFPQWPKASTREGVLLKLPHHLKVLKVAAAYLRILVTPSDDTALVRVLNSPKRGVGKGSLERVVARAEEKGVSLLEALSDAAEVGVKGPALLGMDEFLDLHRTFADRSSERPADLLRSLLEKSGYLAEVEAGDSSETQLGVLERLLEVADEYGTAVELVEELDHQEDLRQQPKPKTASLFKKMFDETSGKIDFDQVTLKAALQLLSLPRTVGTHDGVEITVQNGPYGPYLKCGDDTRDLADEEQLFTITCDECVALLAQPKKYRRAAATPPLAEFGPDPVAGKPVLLRDGKYGLYVTDGEYNATLQLGDEPEELTAERVAELLAEARLKGPPKRGRGRRKPGGKG